MKTLKLIISLLCILFTGVAQKAFAIAESEPNDTWNAANVVNLSLGATGTGTGGLNQNQDWVSSWTMRKLIDIA